VLHTFAYNSDLGTGPLAGVVLDKAGNIYGTTATGGTGNSGYGYGTVFKLTPTGTYTVLYSFMDLPPKMRQPVKRQNPWNGENESWDCLAGGLLGSSS
jgi:hypothetical protein